ncbi:MAG TPA: TonB-dependent receptor [Allosphingosinicella sp.]|nr:TonB-dependent receptor [Allosphingosinicella sp.]
MTKKHFAVLLLVSTASIHGPAIANAQESMFESEQDLSGLSIEELAQIPVRSASKREEPLSHVPTAMFVITGDEIAASAANSVPEALRLAPNLQVQQVDARQYAISARGFNGIETSNKLLVLLDGRSVYSPLASTVFWELHNRPVEDIAQIEIISGPGGTLYGPNAVNGVVNLITRDARDTVGGLVRATAGNRERTLAARYGAPIGENGALRVYGQYYDREGLPGGAGPDTNDRFRGWQAGFRSDFDGGPSHFTIQGDVFDSDTGRLNGDGDRGHNLLARWTTQRSEASAIRVQAYYDHIERNFLLVHDSLQTFDLETQFNLTAGVHEIVAGGGIRTTRDEFINNLNNFQLVPPSRRLWVYNAFVQDRIGLTPELSLILGIKAEQTSFTGVELLPNVRAAWHPNPETLLWAAVSRAVRTPSRIDRQLAALPLLAAADAFASEKLIAFEAGYRGQPTLRTSLTVSVFYNLYEDIRTTEFIGNPLPIQLRNGLEGHSYGIEAWSSTQFASWWRLSLGLTTLWKSFEMAPGRTDLAGFASLGRDPDYQLLARSHMILNDRLHLNAGLRWVGELEPQPGIASYVEADARLSYRMSDQIEFYVAGQNLLHRRHLESADTVRGQAAQRSLYAGTRLRF